MGTRVTLRELHQHCGEAKQACLTFACVETDEPCVDRANELWNAVKSQPTLAALYTELNQLRVKQRDTISVSRVAWTAKDGLPRILLVTPSGEVAPNAPNP